MRTRVLYYEKMIAEKELAIQQIINTAMAARIVTSEQALIGVQKMVKDIIDQSPDVLDYRTVRARCLNAHPNQRDKIIRQIWSVCNYFARHGGRVTMPERREKSESINRIAGVTPGLILNGNGRDGDAGVGLRE